MRSGSIIGGLFDRLRVLLEDHCVVSSGLSAWNKRWHVLVAVLACGALRSILFGVLKNGRESCGEVALGSGQFETPWERMQCAKLRMSAQACWTWTWDGWPPFGSRCSQALCAAEKTGLPASS